MVVSGINLGANMGDDTIYSGTVAAATEGYLLGIPSVAISLASKTAAHFETAAKVAVDIVQRHARAPAGAWLLNVNVPDVPISALRGIEVTRLGRRHKAEDVIRAQNPRGETVYWVGAAGEAADAGEGTDFHAVVTNHVSVTPLQIDLTHRDLMRGRDDTMASAGVTRRRWTSTRDGIGMTSARTRTRMVERLREQGIADEVVLAAMNAVPRHIFVDEALASRAYDDVPLPIGRGQTISQPWVVARMTELARNGRTWTTCSKSAPAAATRPRCSRTSLATCTAWSASRAVHESAAQPAVAQAAQRLAQARRRQPRSQAKRSPSTRSSSPPAPRTFPRRCCATSIRAGAWCCRSRKPATSVARSG